MDDDHPSSEGGNRQAGSPRASVETSQAQHLRETAAATTEPLAQLPESFGRYRILKRLGAGAMGTVHLARDTQLDRLVAVKTPSFRATEEPALIQRFYREARAAATLQHRNICPVFDVGQLDGRHYITMAYIQGRPLSQFVRISKPLPARTAAILVHRLATALSEAHRHHIVHRDLKPANIMIDQQREPVVMDFGLARRVGGAAESRMTQTGMIVGTPAYMSPEQVRADQDQLDHTTDIYSLGVILYELLTGRVPFQGSISQVICQIATEQPDPPSRWRRDLDPQLESICLKMMAKRREDRYASMEEAATAIKQYLTELKQGRRRNTPDGAFWSLSGGSKFDTERPDTAAGPPEAPGRDASETADLDAFFAAHMSPDPPHPEMEPRLSPAVLPAHSVPGTRGGFPQIAAGASSAPARVTRSSSRRMRVRAMWIVAGLSAGLLALGVAFGPRTPSETAQFDAPTSETSAISRTSSPDGQPDTNDTAADNPTPTPLPPQPATPPTTATTPIPPPNIAAAVKGEAPARSRPDPDAPAEGPADSAAAPDPSAHTDQNDAPTDEEPSPEPARSGGARGARRQPTTSRSQRSSRSAERNPEQRAGARNPLPLESVPEINRPDGYLSHKFTAPARNLLEGLKQFQFVFKEDELAAAGIDLDQIVRTNVKRGAWEDVLQQIFSQLSLSYTMRGKQIILKPETTADKRARPT